MKKSCIVCTKSFEALRKDAKYCSDTCKVSNYKTNKAQIIIQTEQQNIIEKQQKERESKIVQQIEAIEAQNINYTNKINSLENNTPLLQNKYKSIRVSVSEIETQLRQEKSILHLSDVELYNKYLNTPYQQDLEKGYTSSSKKVTEWELNNGYKSKNIQTAIAAYRLTLNKHIEQMRSQVLKLNEELEKIENEIQSIPVTINRLMEFMKLNITRLRDLDNLRFSMQTDKLSAQTHQEFNRDRHKNGFSGSDLAGANFDTFQLPTELGNFLGKLERYKLAIAITGEPSSGKSHFSYDLAKTFIMGEFSVKYYSLEEGAGSLAQQKILKYGLSYYGAEKFCLVEHGKLHEIRQDAKKYDVIIIDSYGKLKANPDQFDKLRHEFPKTIFIAIFQQTSSKTTRGGAAIDYDCSIQLVCSKSDGGELIATTHKSRYISGGYQYSIIHQRVIG